MASSCFICGRKLILCKGLRNKVLDFRSIKNISTASTGDDKVKHSNSSGPLAGVRIVDMTRVLAGPYCAMLLGDLGAEVLKIEQPGKGDDTRSWAPPWVKNESAYFLAVNRNKKSIAVNITKPEGSKIVQELASKSDVFIENYIPGRLARYGLGYAQLSPLAPRLIYTSITGFGQTGPYAERGGYDNIAAAVGGLMHITGTEDNVPCRVGVAMTDMSTGLYAYGAVMAALLQRQTTGRGQHIDCNLLNVQVATLSHIASNYLNCGVEGKRYGTGHPSLVPYQAFKTKDEEYLLIGAGTETLFVDLCTRLQLKHLLQDPLYADNDKRVVNRLTLVKILVDKFAEKNLSDWMKVLEGSSCPYGPINSLEEVFKDPQVKHNQMIQEIQHSTVGNIRVPAPAVRYSDIELSLRCPPPTLGQHTFEVIEDILGYPVDKLRQLKLDGVIQ